MKKITALFAMLLFALSMFPATAYAGDATITQSGTYDISSFGDNSVLTISGDCSVSLTNNNDVTYSNFRIICDGSTILLGLDNIKISSGSEPDCPAITFTGRYFYVVPTVHASTIDSSGSENAAGIQIADGANVTIIGDTTLYVKGGKNAAGIGGGKYGSGGDITISGPATSVYAYGGENGAGVGNGALRFSGRVTIKEGAFVEAHGGESGAGIGGGALNVYGDEIPTGEITSAASITIQGADTRVIAYSGYRGAGIGSGQGFYDIGGASYTKSIQISEATVTATGGTNAAGIGCADGGFIDKIIIKNANVTAYGDDYGAGVGGASDSCFIDISIQNSSVKAYGGDYAPGIGDGQSSAGCDIHIENSTIEALGGVNGAGIGAGSNSEDDVSITITGSDIEATGGAEAAGIGGGCYPADGCEVTISISGSTISATGMHCGAGIGSAYFGNRAYINITDSNVDARCDPAGSFSYVQGGAGIGTGSDSYGARITITGGNVYATGGANSAGIGGGYNPSFQSGDSLDITIENARVTAVGGVSYESQRGGAGIGQGGSYQIADSYDCTILISGEESDIYATGGGHSDSNIVFDPQEYEPSGELWPYGGAGIGGGYKSQAANITVSGGRVLAESGYGGAGIGGGFEGISGTVSLEGGIIFADGNTFNDIGDGYSSPNSVAPSFSGESIVFVRNDICYPEPVTDHFYVNLSDSDKETFYGLDLHKGWYESGLYYKSSLLISYDKNGGTGTVPDPKIVLDLPSVFIFADYPTNLSFDRRSFVCWCGDPHGLGARYLPGNYYNVPKDTTLYAIWSAIEVDSVDIEQDELEILHHDTSQLSVSLLPDDADDTSVTWESSDSTVAAVDQSGQVTGVSIGSATITASSGAVSDTCLITVSKLPVSGVELDYTEKNIHLEEHIVLTAVVYPADASYPELSWVSSDPGVAKVYGNGNVVPTGYGTCTISAWADGMDAGCTLSVLPYRVSTITLSSYSKSVYVGDWFTISAAILPANAVVQKVTWSSTNENVATVSDAGIVQAIGDGFAKIIATADEVSVSCNVSVGIKAVTGLTLDRSSLSMDIGEMYAITADVTPEDAADPTVTWQSSDDKVADVTSAGIVEAVGPGECTITASSGNQSAKCSVSVAEIPEITVDSVVLSINSAEARTLYVGDTIDLSAYVFPSDAEDRAINWSSSDTSVATVTSNGRVSAVGVGNAVIRATAGGKRDAYSITVLPHVSETPSPTAMPAHTAVLEDAAPSETFATATLTPAQPTPSASGGVREVAVLDLDTSTLPDGTKYLLFPDGTALEVTSGMMRIDVPIELIDANGGAELVALNPERIPLGSVILYAGGAKSAGSGMPAWAIVIISLGILLVGVGGTLMFVRFVIRKR